MILAIVSLAKYSTLRKLYKPQPKTPSIGICSKYSTLRKLYKPQLVIGGPSGIGKYSTLRKLYKPQPINKIIYQTFLI